MELKKQAIGNRAHVKYESLILKPNKSSNIVPFIMMYYDFTFLTYTSQS